MDTANLRIITDLKKFLVQLSSHTDLWRQCVTSEKAFTRKRCLPLGTLVMLILNLPKRSLSVEIKSFYFHIGQKSCSKSAFCQQRAKLKPFFFELWNSILVKSFYRHYRERIKRWKGFVLLAFDDSVISLPSSKELSDIYGHTRNAKNQYGVAAQGCVMFDVLNKIVVNSSFLPYMTSERSVVMQQLEHAPENSLLTFDRGYPAFWLFYQLLQNQHKFIMRVKSDFSHVVKNFVNSDQQDSIEAFHPIDKAIKQMQQMGMSVSKETTLYLRLVKIPLKSGETEILITNLYSTEAHSREDLKEAYRLRWGIETCFGTLKNQLQIESFSGTRKICIEQDFFANIFVYNLQSIIEKQCEQAVSQISSTRKHNYQINKNIGLAFLKNRIVDLFLKENPKQILLELQALFEQHLEPVRPNRSYQRIQRKKSMNYGKYHTLNNYKRAI